MIRGKFRVILYFDLAMVPHPSDAPAIPLADFIPDLQKRCREQSAFRVIDNERRVIRLSDIAPIKTNTGGDAIALLFSLGDRDKADPGFTNFLTGKVRVATHEQDEAGGLSVHAIISLTPTSPKGHIYRMVYEDVTGFGRTLIQDFLRSEFKIISEDQGRTFPREGRGEIKTRPMVELSGHASEKIKESLAEGKLLHN
jgi:hypothetical protein